ncbi:MAG TPA: hypothetical protein VHV30_18105, partial [Polyangiaceae bacterium]|nr:hypothetical protein [Polyangiaceae bacterium]
ATLPQWTADYVEITDDILASNDPYWSLPEAAGTGDAGADNDCWYIPELEQSNGNTNGHVEPQDRYNLCQATYGAPGSNPDNNLNRDVPIVEAYQDRLIVGRFAHPDGPLETTQTRVVDPGSDNNKPFLKLLTCCFAGRAGFKIRAGGEWVAVGQQGIGLLHHVVPAATGGSSGADAGANATAPRCVLSCDPQAVLLNARSFDIPWQDPLNNCQSTISASTPPYIDRNNILAMRNPMFSYVMWSGCAPLTGGAHTSAARDLTWSFTTSGGFTPLTMPLSGTNGAQVSPQSMLFVGPFGQLAVVDGESQGLVLFDLNSVSFFVNYF